MSLASLIAEVEKLTAPSREVDGRLFGWLHDTEPCGTFMLCFDEEKFQFRHPIEERRAWYVLGTDVPEFTASIDAVVALIEREGLEWLRKSPDAMTVYAPLTDEQEARKEWAVHFSAAGATPAIALLAAFLRAIEARAG